MKASSLVATLLVLFSCALHAQSDTLASWDFDPAEPGRDLSENRNALRIRGEDTRFASDERFGGALLIEEQQQPGDTRQGAQLIRSDTLNPDDAFVLELWVYPAKNWSGERDRAVLIDKKYFYAGQDFAGANNGYLVSLRKNAGKVWMEADLGFGDSAERIASSPIEFEPQRWHHLIFAYDGVRAFRFYLNGVLISERTFRTGGPVAPSQIPLIIGDRYASSAARFIGRIAKVRIYRGAEEVPTPEQLEIGKD